MNLRAETESNRLPSSAHYNPLARSRWHSCHNTTVLQYGLFIVRSISRHQRGLCVLGGHIKLIATKIYSWISSTGRGIASAASDSAATTNHPRIKRQPLTTGCMRERTHPRLHYRIPPFEMQVVFPARLFAVSSIEKFKNLAGSPCPHQPVSRYARGIYWW